MTKKFDVAVVIGRFQIAHMGHATLFEKAKSLADKVVILIGSAYKAPNTKHPFHEKFRQKLIENAVNWAGIDLQFGYIPDTIYDDDEWLTCIQAETKKHIPEGATVALVGHDKDSTSYYLNLFPSWELNEVQNLEGLSATELRDQFFSDAPGSETVLASCVAPAVFEALKAFKRMPQYKALIEEAEFLKNYKKQFESYPFGDPIFVTTDAVVVQAGHVLMVRRKAFPGKGLLALPGGFLDPNERIYDGCVRELKEETGIKLSPMQLKGSLVKTHVFDHPDRSLRGRTITHGFYFKLNETGEFPKTRGSAENHKAEWIPLAEFQNPEFNRAVYEDHCDIVKFFV